MGRLVKYLANLGYGSRREVARLLAERRVRDTEGHPLTDDAAFTHASVHVDDAPLDPAPGSVIALHKPLGYVCSTTDASNPVVYDLLPPRIRDRSPIMAAVGRLDRDTSGLLLLTDDGAFNHRLTSPRAHIPKVYEVTLAADMRGDEAALFASGTLRLAGDDEPLEPADLLVHGARAARITLAEGRYHQVRRMFAAVGNHVDTLARVAIGGLHLADQPSGAWRVLSAEERSLLTERSRQVP